MDIDTFGYSYVGTERDTFPPTQALIETPTQSSHSLPHAIRQAFLWLSPIHR